MFSVIAIVLVVVAMIIVKVANGIVTAAQAVKTVATNMVEDERYDHAKEVVAQTTHNVGQTASAVVKPVTGVVVGIPGTIDPIRKIMQEKGAAALAAAQAANEARNEAKLQKLLREKRVRTSREANAKAS